VLGGTCDAPSCGSEFHPVTTSSGGVCRHSRSRTRLTVALASRALRRHSSPRLAGRQQELRQLAGGFERAERGQASFTLISGEPGVGKTRLVQEHAEWVASRGGLVIVGECLELGGSSLPYGPFSDLVDTLPAAVAEQAREALVRARADAIAALDVRDSSAVHRSSEHLAALGELHAGVLAALQHLAAERPVLLVVEDAHWIDAASRDLLGYLVRRSRPLRIQTIATYRSDALHRRHPLLPFLGEAERWLETERLVLARLGHDEVAAMVEAVSGRRPSRALVDQVFDRSDGNPFFVEELLAAGVSASSTGTSLQQVLAADLDRLSDGARSVLSAAAVLGRRPSHDILVGFFPDETAVVAAIRECVDARLLIASDRPGEPRYEFRHALLQEAAYEELLPAERVALHRQASARLAEGVDWSADVEVQRAGEIAFHAHRAHDLPLAVTAAAAAARASMFVLAHADADRWFSLAIEHWTEVPEWERPAIAFEDLLVQAAEAAADRGDPHRAARLQRRCLDLMPAADAARRATVMHDLFWFHWDAAEVDDYPRVAEEAVALLASEPATSLRATALADLAFARWSTCANVEAERLAREAADVARRAGDVRAEGVSLLVVGMALAGLGRTTAADEPFAAAMDRLRAAGDVDGLARAAHWWANTMELDGRFGSAVAVAREALETVVRAGLDVRHGDALRSVVAENLQELGRWDEALALASGGFDPGAGVPSEIWLNGVTARILIGRGMLEAARPHIHAGEDVPALGPDRIWQLEERLNLAYATGDVETGRQALEAAIGAAHDPERESALWWCLQRAMEGEAAAAMAAARAGNDAFADDCRVHALAAADLLDRSAAKARTAGGSGPLLDAHVAWVAATRLRLAGASDPAAWETAVALRDAIGQRYDMAVGRVRLAEAVLDTDGGRTRAAQALEEARAIAEDLGLVPLLTEIEALGRRVLAAGGGRRGGVVAGPRASAVSAEMLTTGGLSQRELEVLALVAAGRTNREVGEALFISPKTASVHVTHILDKLGVATRVEAALIAVSAGLVPAPGDGGTERR
jgi:DNA-binding CsgD family transcriptional regulator